MLNQRSKVSCQSLVQKVLKHACATLICVFRLFLDHPTCIFWHINLIWLRFEVTHPVWCGSLFRNDLFIFDPNHFPSWITVTKNSTEANFNYTNIYLWIKAKITAVPYVVIFSTILLKLIKIHELKERRACAEEAQLG